MSRVMIVCTEYRPPWNEGEKNIARVLECRLAEHGFEPFVWSKPDADYAAPPRHRLSLRQLAANMRFWADVARAARARDAAVIHLISSVSSMLGVKSFLIKRLSGVPLLLHVTGLASPIRGYRFLLSADLVIVGGSYLKPFFPRAVDVPPVSPHMNARLALPVPDATRRIRRRILYLGSMEHVRGVHTLIDGLAVLREHHGCHDFTTTLAWNGYGAPDYVAHIEERIADRGLRGHVRWEGVVADLSALYREHDVVVIPAASQERMGFPLRLVEALSYGKPVVVSDVGEMPAVAEGAGVVFLREDPEALASGLHRLLTDPPFHRQCARRAYERAAAYDPAHTIHRVARLYRELLPDTPTRVTHDGSEPAAGPGALVISLDFEQHWGLRDKWSVDEVREQLLGVRAAVPALLALFEEFGIHATWATVGFLFFDGRRDLLDALPARRPTYSQPGLSPYDAFASLGDNEKDDPFHFAPSLIRRIADTPHQEIGTHTFSHYYCLEDGQHPADFRDDLEAAVEVTRAKLGRSLRSIVFPRNQTSPAYIAVSRLLGLLAYRGNLTDWAYRPRSAEDESILRRGVRLADAYWSLSGSNSRRVHANGASGLVDVPGSRYLRPYSLALRHLEPLRLRRIKTDLHYAAIRGEVYHLWWHPHDFGVHLAENLRAVREILMFFASLRDAYGMETLTIAEAAERALLGNAVEPDAPRWTQRTTA